MPIRNPFARRPGPAIQDENQRPGSAASGTITDAAHLGFERVDTVGSKASSAFSIRSSRRSQDTGEYKMSVVNDSGVYLPVRLPPDPCPTANIEAFKDNYPLTQHYQPSPVEREASWPRRYLSRASSDRSSSGEIEHFSISRESFDSYRRSFDISAKSPVVITDPSPTRQSLDSHRFPFSSPRYAPPSSRSSLGDQLRPQSQSTTHRRWDWRGGHREPPTPEESWKGGSQEEVEEEEGRFENVGLGDDGVKQQQQQHQTQDQEEVPAPAPKKRGFFAKFGSDSNNSAGNVNAPTEEEGTAVSRFLPLPLVGRKGAQGGGLQQQQQQGAELKVMPVSAMGRQLQEVEV
ncbi:hypothetical protein N657DRAFT_192376 [Parathielavia appendiculata]|uniref:Uncharacterized protein n=1 Tax=Parathielavia appendiculata TaxID=2587402 RepID=A0AAN6U8S3_9PEZI|nr:hypothetical protein N657DRAFT_192376 [Parathielavia appendiculata]